MKNEEKIVELLTEVVRKQDQHEEILLKHTELLGKITDRLDSQGEALGQVARILDGAAKKLSDIDGRITRVEQRLGLYILYSLNSLVISFLKPGSSPFTILRL